MVTECECLLHAAPKMEEEPLEKIQSVRQKGPHSRRCRGQVCELGLLSMLRGEFEAVVSMLMIVSRVSSSATATTKLFQIFPNDGG